MIIGISGKIGSGKDTVAGILQELEPSFQNKKYAGKLKQIAGILLGVDPAKFEDQEYKKQQLGKEWKYWFDLKRDEVADPEEMANYFLNVNQDLGRFIELKPPTVRIFLQRLGTEAMRQRIHTDVWVNALFSDYTPDQNWVITDVRFENEAQRIKEMGGTLIRINRDTGSNSGAHPSETALDNYEGFDVHLGNNGSVSDLELDIKTLWKAMNIGGPAFGTFDPNGDMRIKSSR